MIQILIVSKSPFAQFCRHGATGALLALVLTGCAATAPLSQQAPAGAPASVPAPSISAGDSWTYRVRDGFTSLPRADQLHEVRQVTADRIEVAGAVAVLGYLAQGMVNNLFNVAAAGAVFAVVAGAYVVRLEATSTHSSVTDEADQFQRAPTGPPVELRV